MTPTFGVNIETYTLSRQKGLSALGWFAAKGLVLIDP